MTARACQHGVPAAADFQQGCRQTPQQSGMHTPSAAGWGCRRQSPGGQLRARLLHAAVAPACCMSSGGQEGCGVDGQHGEVNGIGQGSLLSGPGGIVTTLPRCSPGGIGARHWHEGGVHVPGPCCRCRRCDCQAAGDTRNDAINYTARVCSPAGGMRPVHCATDWPASSWCVAGRSPGRSRWQCTR